MRGSDRGGGRSPHGGGAQRDSGGDVGERVQAALRGQSKLTLFSADGKTINAELLDAQAQARAKSLRELAPSQLRRFYGQVVAFRTRLETNRSISDAEVEAQVAAMKANAAYAGARKQPVELVDLFVEASNSVHSAADFLAFARHMQAVVAFHKVYSTSKEGAR